ncbi:MAG: glycerol-3-phosphate acyltransferase [Actinomycetota bacterium]|nr:glycerol-3-phosphate acyltransferase [Actinomycetota bacterium]
MDRPGTAGAGRQFGYKAGIPTFIFDVGKGVLVPLVANLLGLDNITLVIATLAVLIGHNWPVFFKFKGGGGIATTIGIAAYLVPIIFLIVFGISLTVGLTYKYTLRKNHRINPNVIGSALGATLLPILCFAFGQPDYIIILFIGIFLIIVVKGLILHFMYRNIATAN